MKIAKHEKWRKGFPYYKIQWYDDKSRVWREVQRHYKSEGVALKVAKRRKAKTRIVVVHRDHREVLS